MTYSGIHREIMRGYERDRDHAAWLLRERRAEVYRRLPRIKEIDAELTERAIALTKKMLDCPPEDSAALLQELQNLTEVLKAEKQELLGTLGVPDDYFTDINRCNLCRDTAYIESQEQCACLKQRLIDKYYDLSNIKQLLAQENFDNFDLRFYSETISQNEGISPYRNMEFIYNQAADFVATFGSQFQNLLLYGDTGLGKTFVCNCIAKDLLDSGRTVLYVTAPQIFKLVEDYRFNREEADFGRSAMDAVTEVDLLILDDLGTEFDTVVTSAALFNIINMRLLAKLPTVISTNLAPTELESYYSDRIVSRFFGSYNILKFFGDDIRAMKKYRS